MFVFLNFLCFWSLYDLPFFKLPEIEDTQEFITGKWNSEMKNYFPNGNEDGKPKYFFINSYRKNVGDTVYLTVYNKTNQGAKKMLNKYEVLFMNQEKSEAKAFLVEGETKTELAHVNIQIEKDSTRYMRGTYKDSNFSLYLYPSNTARLTFVQEGTKYITNIQFEREVPEGQQENPIKWYTIVGLVGMFGIIGYMVCLPDEEPKVQQQQNQDEVQIKEGKDEKEKNEEDENEINNTKDEKDSVTKRNVTKKEHE